MRSELLSNEMGVVFSAEGERTLYSARDQIWNRMVETNIEIFQPEVIVLAAGDARVPGLSSIIMNAAHVKAVCDAAPKARIVVSHMAELLTIF